MIGLIVCKCQIADNVLFWPLWSNRSILFVVGRFYEIHYYARVAREGIKKNILLRGNICPAVGR